MTTQSSAPSRSGCVNVVLADVSLIDIEQFNSFAGRLLRGVGELADLGAIIDVRRAVSFISVR
ncbi:MAG: hypothetical protein WAK66_15900 [Methylocystis sp.]